MLIGASANCRLYFTFAVYDRNRCCEAAQVAAQVWCTRILSRFYAAAVELCQRDRIIIALISIKIDQKSMINYKQEFKQY